MRLVPLVKRRRSWSATAAKSSTLAAWVIGMSTSSTKPSSELVTMNALAGQSVPQLAQGLGSG